MTLQLEVGKTYRARNGEFYTLVPPKGSAQHKFSFVSADKEGGWIAYNADGRWSGGGNQDHDFDLLEEADPFDIIVAKYEAAWEAEKQAMETVRKTMDDARAAIAAIVQAAKEGKL